MPSGALIPAWIGLPIGGALMIFVAAHLIALRESDAPPSRRRIRQANGMVMLFGIPLLAVGFSVLDAERQPREWTIVWLMAAAMLLLSVLLAGADILNTMRLTRRSRKRLGRSLAELRQQLAAARRDAETGASGRDRPRRTGDRADDA